MNNKFIRNIFFIVFTVVCAGIQSCTTDQKDGEEGITIGLPLKISAQITGNRNTRANQEEGQVETTGKYQEKGEVKSGEFYLSYPQSSNNQYSLGTVVFNQTEIEGMGIAKSSSGTELRWSDVWGSPVNFYLDNVPQSLSASTDVPTTVVFDEHKNPFKAGIFDNRDGTNDLLWGMKNVPRDTRSIGFDLNHVMSRVKIEVHVVHKDNAVENINLDKAEVSLTNLYPEPISYNRLDGSLELNTTKLSPINIVSKLAGYEWNQVVTNDNTETVYTSQDIVLPPQSVSEDIYRPRLEIKLEDGTVYSGILPHAMLVANSNSDNDDLVYPVNLSFLKGHVLTIRTVITEEPPELAFMPVYVVDWVYKGDFPLEAHQAGIYTADEFYKLIDYYEVNNEYQLKRYGYLDKNTSNDEMIWIFDFFSGVTLDYSKIFDKMHANVEIAGKGKTKGFSFDYHNYKVYVENGDDSEPKEVTYMQLYNIVTGVLTWDKI